MSEMLTAKKIQEMLQVDRSTVYRMAEAGQLPAIKVGKQWRFPASQINEWFQLKMAPTTTAVTPLKLTNRPQQLSLNELLPITCVQQIQDTFADLLGVMLVVTDIDGNPITDASHPCGLFSTISEQPNAIQRCIQSWHDLALDIDLAPKFRISHLGLICARSMIRVESELKGMIIAGCIAPKSWPPAPAEVEVMAGEFDVDTAVLSQHLNDVFHLSDSEKSDVLVTLPRIANIIAHIIDERKSLVGRLQAIASLTRL